MPDHSKQELRKSLRKARRAHVEAQSDAIKALIFHRPPSALLARIDDQASVGLYHSGPFEAPAFGYTKFFLEQGRTVALPRFNSREEPMHFAQHSDPFEESDLEIGPFGLLQPDQAAPVLVPDILIVPLIGFTSDGDRLGQGRGHYDRWLESHPGRLAIGLAWDTQLCESLPVEAHDVALDAIITPTRSYGLE
ncbi:MAG: 5-formyltetrahydrofolate cyclo-ligase [Erythrobacter sp.]